MSQAFYAEHLLALIDAAIISAGFHVPDSLDGTTSTPKRHKSASTQRLSSTNTRQYRNQDLTRVQDLIQVEAWFVKNPSAQKASRAKAYKEMRKVRNAVTRLVGEVPVLANIIHLADSDDVDGEYLTITSLFEVHRDEEVGRET